MANDISFRGVTQMMTASRAANAHILSTPKFLVHAEGLVMFIASIALYANQGGTLIAFLLLILTPDISMIGYLASPLLGSITYNTVHTYITPALIITLSLAMGFAPGVQIGAILAAHISMDRTLGYGLKYASAFKDTHLNRL